MRIEIISTPYDELDAAKRQELEAITEHEFGGYPIVRETSWATPDWTFFALQDSRLACFYNLVLRSVRFDEQNVAVAGLNNLITLQDSRNQGIASQLLRQTVGRWSELKAECGLLLCSDALIPFYRRLDWKQIDAPVTFSQGSVDCVWRANCMVLPVGPTRFNPRDINLCGLPW